MLIGGASAQERLENLRRTAPPNMTVEAARPDFRQMLPLAAASVSMCGYNTALDVLQTGCPAVFVPFDDGDEVEQGLRATAMSKLNRIEVVGSSELTAAQVLRAVKAARAAPPRQALQTMDGAQATVRIVETALSQAR